MDDNARQQAREARQQRRRRAPRRFVVDHSVPSPCLSICQIDNSDDLCIGCKRTVDEIREWPILSADDKRAVLARIAERKAAAESR